MHITLQSVMWLIEVSQSCSLLTLVCPCQPKLMHWAWRIWGLQRLWRTLF